MIKRLCVISTISVMLLMAAIADERPSIKFGEIVSVYVPPGANQSAPIESVSSKPNASNSPADERATPSTGKPRANGAIAYDSDGAVYHPTQSSLSSDGSYLADSRGATYDSVDTHPTIANPSPSLVLIFIAVAFSVIVYAWLRKRDYVTNPRKLLQDLLIVFLGTGLAGFVWGFLGGFQKAIHRGVATRDPTEATMSQVGLTLLFGSIAFAIVAYRTTTQKLEHLVNVGTISYWIGLVSVGLGFTSILNWSMSVVSLAIMAMLGGAISSVLDKPSE